MIREATYLSGSKQVLQHIFFKNNANITWNMNLLLIHNNIRQEVQTKTLEN